MSLLARTVFCLKDYEGFIIERLEMLRRRTRRTLSTLTPRAALSGNFIAINKWEEKLEEGLRCLIYNEINLAKFAQDIY